MTAPAAERPKILRPSHRRVLQLFRVLGAMTDQEAYDAAIADGWQISPSGFRSRRSEVSPPRGAGLRDSGRRRDNLFRVTGKAARRAIVWELDNTVDEPYAGRV